MSRKQDYFGKGVSICTCLFIHKKEFEHKITVTKVNLQITLERRVNNPKHTPQCTIVQIMQRKYSHQFQKGKKQNIVKHQFSGNLSNKLFYSQESRSDSKFTVQNQHAI